MCWQRGLERCQGSRTWRSAAGIGAPDQLGNSCQTPPYGIFHRAACQAGQPARQAEGEVLPAYVQILAVPMF